MPATDARLIVLATVIHLEPATGYAIRKRLIEQGVEAWGGMSVASIYSVLKTLTRHGQLEQLDDPTGVRRDTKAYRTTAAGREEFGALWRQAIETVDPAHPLAFNVAITLTALIPQDEYDAALGVRLVTLEQRLAAPAFALPPEVERAARLWRRLAATEADWIRETITRRQRAPSRRARGSASMSKSLRAAAMAAAALALAPAAAFAVTPAFTLESKSVWGAAQPLIGSSIYAPPVNEGGWSGFQPIDDKTFWVVSDRGPNGLPAVGGTGTRRTFLTPAFTPTIYKVAIADSGALNVVQRIPIKLKAGASSPARAWMAANPNPALAIQAGDLNHITGLSQIATAGQGAISGLPTVASARDEVPYAADGVTTLPSDPYGLDSESISVDPRDGSFWIGDEYRPSLVHVAADGTVLNRIVPEGVTVAADPANPAKFAGEDDTVVKTHRILPRAFSLRRQNRGMEGGTLTKDGRTLFGMLQSSIVPPAGQGDGRTLRLVRFDVSDSTNPKLTGEWIYRLSVPQAGSGINQADLSNSDIYALDDTHLIVDEHDNVTSVPGAGEKRVYAIDLAGATNLVDDAAQNGNAPTLESTNAAGVTPVAKTFWLSLDDWGYDHDKPEGLGLFPNGDLGMIDDNDFGFEQGNDPAATSTPPFKVSPSGKTTELWRYDVSNLVEATVGAVVPATLSLTLGAPGTFGAFVPGVTQDYTATTKATVISTAGDASLAVSEPGRLANGAFTLPSPLGVAFSKSAWTAPTSNEDVTITFSQHVDAKDALRTGTYSKTLTFTVSTTAP